MMIYSATKEVFKVFKYYLHNIKKDSLKNPFNYCLTSSIVFEML